MLSKLSSYALALRDRKRTLDILRAGEYEKARKTATIIRIVHSIEKGLCLEQPRLGFGVERLDNLFALCKDYAEDFGNDQFCLKMARDAIKAYIAFHKEKGYESADFSRICGAYDAFPCKDTGEQETFGGTICVKNKCELDIEQLENFFTQRHSIRDFADADIPDETILRAVRAAQYAPSACNRQAVRAYILPSKKVCELYQNDLEGIGGFVHKANRFVMITGQLSAYTPGEQNQHVVSASIFATYLMEALFAQKIGTCIVQRPLLYSKQWKRVAKEIGVPEDERLVLMMAIGYLKDEYMAPVSKRFPIEEIVKFVN